MQPGLLDEQQRQEGNDPAREPDRAHACKDAGRKNHERGDLRRGINVVAAAAGDVRGRNDGDGSREQDGGRHRDARVPQPPAQPPDGPEHGEGPNPSESGSRSVGMP